MKNYIEKKGLHHTDIIYTTPRGSVIRILSVYNDTANSEIITPCIGGSPAGSKGNIKISTMPRLAEQIAAAKSAEEQAFLLRYPGIDELLDIIRLHRLADEALEEMMGTGDSILRATRPKISIEEAHAKYPIASAYLTLLRLSNADPSSAIGFIRRQVGQEAFQQIEKGVDVITALENANNKIKKETETPQYREHVAGL